MADKIKCSDILLKKIERSNCNIRKIKEGESFANLAKELSIDKRSGGGGGELGLFGRRMMVRPFEEAAAAFKLKKVGMMPEPVKTEFGYHI